MLHIVNGECVAEKLRQGGVAGDILVWREVYSEGPIFVDPAESTNRSYRARYLEKAMGIPRKEYVHMSETQEKLLADFNKYSEVILWFEHDLFDQTMLCYLLHRFAQQPLGETKLSILSIDAFPGIELFRGLGQLTIEQLKSLLGTWQSIGLEELKLGKKVWKAYSSPDPNKLVQLLQEDTTALPFVHDAFQLHLSRFPSTHNGLGIVEQITLEMVRDGINSPLQLFEHVGGKLHRLGMGDLQYWCILAKLSQCQQPLLHIEKLKTFPNFKDPSPSFKACHVVLTELGRKVLDDQDDLIQTNGIDEWYGGVHLVGQHAQWRWDTFENRLKYYGK